MSEELIKGILGLLRQLSDSTVLWIAGLATFCFLIYKAREMYKDYTSGKHLDKALDIVQKAVNDSLQNIRADITALTNSINNLVSRL